MLYIDNICHLYPSYPPLFSKSKIKNKIIDYIREKIYLPVFPKGKIGGRVILV
jgi:hypothetical protein